MNNTSQFEDHWPFTLSKAILLPSTLVTNSVSLLYILFKLKINSRVSKILIMDTVCKLVLTLTASVGFFTAYITGLRTFEICTIFLSAMRLSFLTSMTFPSVTSVIRYHMATRMANHQLFQEWCMNCVTGFAISALAVVCIGTLFFQFVFQIPFGPFTLQCVDPNTVLDTSVKDFAGPLAIVAFGGMGLLVGIIFDIAMFRFLKKRQEMIQPQIAMVAWAPQQPLLVSPGQYDYSKRTIPIQATCLGVVNLILLFILSYTSTFHFFSLTGFGEFILQNHVNIYVAMHMPLLLLLTVKSNEMKKPSQAQVSPPLGLQFHDE